VIPPTSSRRRRYGRQSDERPAQIRNKHFLLIRNPMSTVQLHRTGVSAVSRALNTRAASRPVSPWARAFRFGSESRQASSQWGGCSTRGTGDQQRCAAVGCKLLSPGRTACLALLYPCSIAMWTAAADCLRACRRSPEHSQRGSRNSARCPRRPNWGVDAPLGMEATAVLC
jgi:hypothetical protein